MVGGGGKSEMEIGYDNKTTVQVRLPYPFEPALISMYGPGWTVRYLVKAILNHCI